ncbi:hypothetical protein P20311_2533 [Pseudoalteromonas sp. BSi20311]|nr:hypothetical protein P20311_2533 [Pseudoalteromonas sp. BSi20311]GAA73423.1 hypothetical protein P20439_3543 [Pseudoalteromonas sp. BSi20439]
MIFEPIIGRVVEFFTVKTLSPLCFCGVSTAFISGFFFVFAFL